MIKEMDKQYVMNNYARVDVLFVKGKGCTLYDDTGKSYIDFASGIAVNGLGIANKKWAKAVCAQIKRLPHTSNWYYSEPSAVLAHKLCERTGLKKAFFSNSGAEANEAAIKAARKYHFDKGADKYEIVTLNNSFHGRTLATVTATGQPNFQVGFAPMPEGFKYADANDFDSVKNACTDKTAAIMMELVQGEGGVLVLDKEFVISVADFCCKNDILLIIDEVQTGNGRTGTLFAFSQYSIMPDIVTTAKGLGNGLPIGATLFGAKCEKVFTYGSHGTTFGGNLAVCAGAVEVLNQIDSKLLAGVAEKRKILVDALVGCSKVKSVCGLGLLIGIECENAKSLMLKCLEKGLVVLTAKDKLRLLPALNISDAEFNKGLNILKEVLA